MRITVAREAARLAASVRDAGDAEPTFEDAVVAMVVRAARELRDHEALQFLFAFEPELVLPHVTFDAGDRFLVAAGSAIAPALARFLPAARTRPRPANGSPRVVLTYALSPTRPIDLTDAAAARALVRELVLPGLLVSETVT